MSPEGPTNPEIPTNPEVLKLEENVTVLRNLLQVLNNASGKTTELLSQIFD